MRGLDGPDPDQGKRKARIVPFLLRICVSAALLYFAFRNSNWNVAIAGLRTIRVTWLGAGIFFLVLQLALGALRWSGIARLCGIPLSFAASLRYSLIAAFFGQMLPSTVGADGTRIWLLGRKSRHWSKAAYSVVMDRVAGCLAIAFVVVACFPALSARIGDPAGRVGLIVLTAGSLAVMASVPLLSIIPRSWLARVPVARHATAMADNLRGLFKLSRESGAIAVYSVIIHLLSGMAVWSLAHSLSAPLSFADAVVLVPPVMLIAMIPVSVAGWGVREGAMVAILHYGGIANATGFLISVLFGLAMLAIGMAGGGVWILGNDKAKP